MSYIRPCTNPEGLYIIGTDNDQIEIFYTPYISYFMPRDTFVGVLRDWWAAQYHLWESSPEFKLDKNNNEYIAWGGARITSDVWHWILSYAGWSIRMHHTTLHYLAHGVVMRGTDAY